MDEEFKLLYVIFKDYVLGTNDDVIVYHEPSDRWVSFVDSYQTPVGGYNVPLELSYTVVKGFDAGIGFSFDEDTRFAVFDIQTPKNYNPGMDIAALTITALDPTVTVSESPAMDVAALTVTAYDPVATFSNPLTVTIDGINTITPGTHGTTMYAFVSYTNTGDAGTENIDYRIRNSSLVEITTGTISQAFASETSSSFTITTTYPTPAGSYSIQVKRSATPTWTGAKTMGFTSL